MGGDVVVSSRSKSALVSDGSFIRGTGSMNWRLDIISLAFDQIIRFLAVIMM